MKFTYLLSVFLLMPFFSNAEFIIEQTTFTENEGYLDYNAYFINKGLETLCQLSFNETPDPVDESLSFELMLGADQELINVTFVRTGFNTEEYTGSYSVWRGSNENGTITISTEDDISAFYVSYNGQDYTGVESVDSKGYFFKVPGSNYETCGVGEDVAEGPASVLCDGDVCAATVKVLLLHSYEDILTPVDNDLPLVYSNNYRFTLGTARKMQVLSVLAVNQDVFNNSGVALHLTYEFQYVNVPDESVGFTQWEGEYENLRDQYTNLKNQTASDIVQVIIDDNRWRTAGGADGDLDLIDLDFRYMTFAHLWASSDNRYTSAHEIAHIFGAAHASGEGGPVICAGGLNFRGNDEDFSRTVMSFSDADDQRIPYLSDPDETFDGFEIGGPALRNADVLRDAICRVDNISTQVPWSFEIITGIPTCIDLDGTNGNSVFEVEVTPPVGSTPGRGPYIYRWEEITNGQVNFIVTTMSTSVDLRNYLTPLPVQGQRRTIQVTAIASDEATLSESFSFHDVDCGFFGDDVHQLRIEPTYQYFNTLGQEVYIDSESMHALPQGIYIKCSSVGDCIQFLIQ